MLLSPNFGDYKFTHNFLIDNKLMILMHFSQKMRTIRLIWLNLKDKETFSKNKPN